MTSSNKGSCECRPALPALSEVELWEDVEQSERKGFSSRVHVQHTPGNFADVSASRQNTKKCTSKISKPSSCLPVKEYRLKISL